jgi:hypothetical protein
MHQQEEPWMPRPSDIPWTVALINSHGDRHLAFNDSDGRFYRLWEHQPPQPLHAGEAVLLRPSDVDQIIKSAAVWIINNSGHPRAYDLSDEIAIGTKALVTHLATQAETL